MVRLAVHLKTRSVLTNSVLMRFVLMGSVLTRCVDAFYVDAFCVDAFCVNASTAKYNLSTLNIHINVAYTPLSSAPSSLQPVIRTLDELNHKLSQSQRSDYCMPRIINLVNSIQFNSIPSLLQSIQFNFEPRIELIELITTLALVKPSAGISAVGIHLSVIQLFSTSWRNQC